MTAHTAKGAVLANGRTANVVGFRDRRVSPRTVACPTCKAPAGEDCVSATGRPANHPVRRRMAIRAESRPWDPADIRFARHLSASVRRAIRHNNKVTLRGLAELVGTSHQTIGFWENGAVPSDGVIAAAYGKWLREHRDVVA